MYHIYISLTFCIKKPFFESRATGDPPDSRGSRPGELAAAGSAPGPGRVGALIAESGGALLRAFRVWG